jgi:hypothetical protein
MGVAREIGEHRCGSGEWPLGVDDPFGPSQRSERGGEGAPVSKGYEIAEEGQPPGLMQRREAFEKQPPEEVEKYTILHDIGDIVGALRRVYWHVTQHGRREVRSREAYGLRPLQIV